MSLRMAAVQAPIIPILGEWIRQSPGTISLGQGMVGYGPPPEALAAVPRFLAEPGAHRYGPVEGLPALVEALTRKLTAENRLDLSRSRVVVTAGGNLAFMNAVLAVADPGDEVILQAPYYFNHEMAVVMAGCRPVVVPTDARYQLQVDAIAAAITPRTRAVVTISPNNPSGAVYPEADLRAVNALCAARGVWHIHDEVYEYFTYGLPHFSPASIPGADAHTISLYSLSKAYGFASWRIGYMTVPETLWVAVNKIQDTLLICPPHVSQAAAVGALAAGRAYCDGHIAAAGAPCAGRCWSGSRPSATSRKRPSADGALYCLVRVNTTLDSMTLAERLIREHQVATVPGSAFGARPTARTCACRMARWRRRRSTRGWSGSCAASKRLSRVERRIT